ncbi:MAG: HAD hydrolase family protein [Elusimicrobiales bacterium]|nr:HAD hydrolase family protein [Elusimicrobiales bacterium]
MTINEKELTEKASKIKMLLMDVDGVLTDGKMYFIPGPDGKMVEFKGFNSLDGIGLRLLNQFGIKTGIITGRISPATLQRAKNLGMTHLYQGFVSKLEPMKIIAKEEKIKADEIAYIGDDWTDIPALKAAGLACAPANARQEVKDNADYISPSKGGEGAVRDACELILYSKGLKEQIMKQVSEACWPPIIKKEIKVITGKE